MAMNKEELIKHKESLEAELKTDELALSRLKARVDYQRKYIKLCVEQIDALSEIESKEVTQ
jgi:hypothetical protein